jgi:hypothetical protein
MAQALLVEGREQEEEWGVVRGEGEGLVETALGQAPAGSVCVLAVGQGPLTRQVIPVMI